ncbi:hypothetical protein A7X67_01095 [Clostridium sp. W14A]|nr:hypothetical protein A7X67_07130 [Clostridium sp. W14A]OCN01717.1 hypothetical protein A7X67_01095 [Clostridium sp. W14A]
MLPAAPLLIRACPILPDSKNSFSRALHFPASQNGKAAGTGRRAPAPAERMAARNFRVPCQKNTRERAFRPIQGTKKHRYGILIPYTGAREKQEFFSPLFSRSVQNRGNEV